MKAFKHILFFPFAIQSAAVPHEKRQFDIGSLLGIDPFLGGLNNDFLGSFGGLGGLVESFGGISGLMKANEGVLNMLVNSLTIRSSSTEYLKPQLRDNAKRVKLKYGPIRIKGSKTNAANQGNSTGNFLSYDPLGTSFIHSVDYDFPTDAMLLYSTLKVYGEDGKELSLDHGLYPHHIIFGKPTKIPTFPTFIYSAAELAINTFTLKNSNFNSGFYIPKGDKVFIQGEIVNYKEYDQDIWLVPEIEYIPGKPEGYSDSDLYIISPETCDSKWGVYSGTFKPKAGATKFNLTGSDMTFENDGTIVWSRGHMHDGGTDITIRINDQVICISKGIYGGESRSSKTQYGNLQETLSGLTDCPSLIKIKKGDRLNVAANFDLGLHPARAMGGDHHGSMSGGHNEVAELMAYMVMQFSPLKS